MEKYILQLGEMTWSKVVFGGLIVGGLYWSLWYNDGSQLTTAIEALTNQLGESERQLRDTKEAMANAEKFEKAVRQNEMQFEKVLEYLPQETNANELTRLINQQAQMSGSRVTETKPRDAIEKKDFYEMTKIDFSLQGGFPQVVLFLSSLSKVQKLLTFDKLVLKQSDRGGGADSLEAPKVELRGVLVGYRYLKEKDPVPGAPPAAGGGNAPNR